MTAAPPEIARLQAIRTFPELIEYLRDVLDWPIEEDTAEDEAFFEYDAAEVGLNEASAVKVERIRRLRPLVSGQPWGIFFIEFKPGKLPITVLRRILRALVVKKRAGSDKQRWEMGDLLFISILGEQEDRGINLAHFSDDGSGDERAALRVVDWDEDDAHFHMLRTADELNCLRWPDNGADPQEWRETWSAAFRLKPGEVAKTSAQLAIQMADLARLIRSRVNGAMAIESSGGPLNRMYRAFKEVLVGDLTPDGFADMYAQTITYGLFAARRSRPMGVTAETARDMVPNTNPFLRDLLAEFTDVSGASKSLDFDELGIDALVEVLNQADMDAIVADFDDKNPAEDPVIHFYEDFLQEYDSKLKAQRGIFFTPRPVVSFIVRSVDELLRSEFGLEDGLADTTTWGEMKELQRDLNVPEGTDPDTPFVQILDPAVGTGTFLVEVIDVIWKTMRDKWQRQGKLQLEFPGLWNDYVPRHLLPRLYGYELMMAPYAIAHMKIGLKLSATGYRFGDDERLRVYLTNSLEPSSDTGQRALEGILPALAHEAQAVSDVKRSQRFTVVIGNPPYSKLSSNRSEWIDALLHGKAADGTATPSYYECDGAPLGESTVWIQDDYIKFIRLSQWLIDQTGVGIHSYISNNGYLDNPTLRGMRQQLRTSFRQLHVLDLHGSTKRGDKAPGGASDQNVFDIQQGVAIGIFVKTLMGDLTTVNHADLWGDRVHKYRALSSARMSSFDYANVTSVSPFHLFVPTDTTYLAEYNTGWKVTDIFGLHHSGIITKRDSLTIHWTAGEAFETVSDFVSLSPEEAREKYELPLDVRDWKVVWAQADLRDAGLSKERVIPVLYRPFDVRFTYFTGRSRGFVGWPVADMTRLMLTGDNVALVTTRMTKGEGFAHCLISPHMVEVICLSAKTSNNGFAFPLYVDPSSGEGDLLKASRKGREANLSPGFCEKLSERLYLDYTTQGGADQSRSFGPTDVFGYIAALLHSAAYRERYRDFLSRDFPRILLPGSLDLFRHLARLGDDLVDLHLMKSLRVDDPVVAYAGPKNPEVGRVGWSDGTVWLDAGRTSAREGHRAEKPGTIGFGGVPEDVWDFHIGGYQVCHKWLKVRKGRMLSDEDIAHYQKIVVALSETIRIMGEIDEVIEKHGGWPGAFATGDGESS